VPILEPIGVIRSAYVEKREAPRQGVAGGAPARLELVPGRGFEHALEGLEGFSRVWLLAWFDRAEPGPNKVLPPRSPVRRGVFATRSPHRPNPIGLTAAKLLRIDGLALELDEVDLLDGTPILDVKPYVPYADAFPDESSGWLERPRDPIPAVPVDFSERARAELAFLAGRGVDLEARIAETLALGADPKPYRRIRRRGADGELAVGAWRVDFREEEGSLCVVGLRSGFRAGSRAAASEERELHEAFVAHFGG
jgi:tRNA-Thr(GGU) m(6)t(6)A37 methyltransferase TsaA